MTFVEFLECIVRVAEKLEIPHILKDEVPLPFTAEITSEDRERYSKKPLLEKLEAFIIVLMKCYLTPKQVKEAFDTWSQYDKAKVQANDISVTHIKFG